MFHVNIGVESISQDSLLDEQIRTTPRTTRNCSSAWSTMESTTRSTSSSALRKTIRGFSTPPAFFTRSGREAFFNTVTPRKHADAHQARAGRPRHHPRRRHVHQQLPLHVRAQQAVAAAGQKGRGATKEFYSFKSMFKRLLLPPNKFSGRG